MKTKLLLLFTLLFFWKGEAQIIQFADADFKKVLLDANSDTYIAFDSNNQRITIDTNYDGEISIREASEVYSLDIQDKNISSVEGINNFSNLTLFYAGTNNMTSLKISNLSKLKILYCYSNKLINLELENLPLLETLNASYNQLSKVDLSTIPSLKNVYFFKNLLTEFIYDNCYNITELNLGGNDFINFDLKNLPKLTKFDIHQSSSLEALTFNNLDSLEFIWCSNSNLKALHISNLSNLQTLSAYDNKLTALTIDNCPKFSTLDVYHNLLETIDVSTFSTVKHFVAADNLFKELDLSTLTIDKNSNNGVLNQIVLFKLPNLEWINLKNNTFYNPFNYFGGDLDLNFPNLKYVCCDPFEELEMIQVFANENKVANINTYCSFTPINNYNSIIGNLKLNELGSICDESTPNFFNTKVKLEKDGQFIISSTDLDGNYKFYASIGNYLIAPVLESPNYYTVTPNSTTINFADANNNTATQNFCIVPNGIHNDFEVQMTPISQATPGFNSEYQIIYKNKGTTTLSGNVLFAFNDDKIDYVSSDINPDQIETGRLTFNFTDLKPFEEKVVTLILKINPPTDANFPVNGGDILSYSAQIFPISGDETPRDNTFALRQEVVNSLDPNDKTCLEGDIITPEMIGTDLHYLIRFENMGTANAVNVVVKDMIDTTKFDIESLQPIKSSHPYRMTITEGNKVEFFFEDIQLPFDDANNDGYILFKIKTLPSVVLGDVLNNTADIYFDYNFPVTTNTTETIVQESLATDEVSNVIEASIYPNPVKDILYIKSTEKIEKAEIYDLSGRLIKVEVGVVNNQVNVSNLKAGNYIIKVSSNKKIYQTKLIKQ